MKPEHYRCCLEAIVVNDGLFLSRERYCNQGNSTIKCLYDLDETRSLQVLGARLGVTPRSSSVSPRLAATVHPTSTPKVRGGIMIGGNQDSKLDRNTRVSARLYGAQYCTKR